MKHVHLIIPARANVTLTHLVEALETARDAAAEPFSEAALARIAAFSSSLFKDPEARRYPELQALAFFMRRARLKEFEAHFNSLNTAGAMLVPRGLVFHIPPRNVTSILVYSWLMAELTGNASVIRVPGSRPPELSVILRLLGIAAGHENGSRTFIVEYEHDDDITATISALADVRVIWGGDETVNRLRKYPLAPSAKEITFPDKRSAAVLSSAAYVSADLQQRNSVASSFFKDAFWFDQMACSSPRILIWLGQQEDSVSASADFFERLSAHVSEKGHQIPCGSALNKRAFACGAIMDGRVSRYRDFGNEITVLDVKDLGMIPRDHCGSGLFFQYFAAGWDEIISFIRRHDQTLTHYGFDERELRRVARALNGRGIDRMVPFGQALDFSYVWDGYDLFQELSRRVHVQAVA